MFGSQAYAGTIVTGGMLSRLLLSSAKQEAKKGRESMAHGK
jgi:hypothetical protein